ncbi:hypothetical protein FRC12_008918 [Ceratobasidium sp. 428]|nr:hypothetical protein FRC12_008918 [Ceratobasidium sp. 428]
MQLTEDDHPLRPIFLNNLGNTYQSLFQHLGKSADLDKSVNCFEQMIPLVPDDHPHKSVFLNNLGGSYRSRFERLGRLEDLKKSITHKTQAVQLASDTENFKPLLLNSLGNSYQSLFERFGRREDSEKAIAYLEQAINLAPEHDPEMAEYLNCLGIAYRYRFDRLGLLEDLKKCAECFEQAVSLMDDDQPHKPTLLSNLGVAYFSIFERLSGMETLYKSVKYLELALPLALDDVSHKFVILTNLGNAHQLLFWRFGKPEDLTQAINYLEQAAQLAPDDHPTRLEVLGSLGKAYQSMFSQLGKLADLDKSISYFEQLVALIPDDEPLKSDRLSNLGHAYLLLSERLGRLEDLDKSVEHSKRAVELTPDDNTDKPAYIANLGSSCLGLFRRLGRSKDLENSVGYFERALQLTPDGHPIKPNLMNSLGLAHQLRFKHLAELGDLEKSVSCHSEAVTLTPDDHRDKPPYLMNQGNSYYARFKNTRRPGDLEDSINCLRQAAQLVSDDESNKSAILMSLGLAYFGRSEFSALRDHGFDALDAFKHASLLSSGSPAIKFRTSDLWARVTQTLNISPLEAYTRAMTLLPQVVWLGASIQARYEGLSQVIQGLVMDASSVAVRLQRYDLAIEWLEQGRSIVWSQTLQLRTPLDLLQASYPAVAEELKQISDQLEHVSLPSSSRSLLTQNSSSSHEVTQTHRRLAEKREELLESIRRLSGFEHFLEPIAFDELANNVKDGAVVVIIAHDFGCDSLVVQSGSQDIIHVPLHNFSIEKAKAAHIQLQRYLNGSGTRRGVKYYQEDTTTTFTDTLAMLWYDVVHPVLARLNITQVLTPVDDIDLPHITWCTTGVLSFLPLHAAGDHLDPRKVLANLAISSYAPTLSSLAQSNSSADSFSGILAVGHESTIRGLSALPGVQAELDRVAASARGLPFTRLDGEAACAEPVLQAMMRHSWVHIACHGSQNSDDPMKSAFHLHDTDLDLATIARCSLKNADLAFLSACQTATGHETLPDESAHLAAGLLMSGYSTVIATMWSIHDEDAPLVAEKVYEYLLKDGVADSRKAANALHRAVANLRDKIGVENYARWMPYVHIGR